MYALRRWMAGFGGRPQMWSGLGNEKDYVSSLFKPSEATLLNKWDIYELYCI